MAEINLLQQVIIAHAGNAILLIMLFITIRLNPVKTGWKDILNVMKGKFYNNPSIIRFVTMNGVEIEEVVNNIDVEVKRTMKGTERKYLVNPLKATRRKKIPIYTWVQDKAQGVDFFGTEHANKLDAELYNNSLVNAQASGSADFFKKLFGYRHIWLAVLAIAIGAVAAGFFSFQIMNTLNSIDICKIADVAASGAQLVTK